MFVNRTLCFAVAKPSSYHVDHLYTPLPVAYLERGVTSLSDDVSDNDVNEGELRGGMRVTYTASGCSVSPVRVGTDSVSPVRVGTDSVGVKLGRHTNDTAAAKLRRLLCCRKRDKVLPKRLLHDGCYTIFHGRNETVPKAD